MNCLAEPIWRICSKEAERKVELQKLKLILMHNEYPTEVINTALNRFLEKKANFIGAIQEDTEKQFKRFLKLPYVNLIFCEET